MAAMMKSILRPTGHWPLVAFVCTALAVFSGGIRDSNYNIAISTPSCPQATTLLGRMDGSQNTSAVTNLICGMVADGNWSSVLDVFASNGHRAQPV